MTMLQWNELREGMFVQVFSYYYDPRYGYLTDESIIYRGVLQGGKLDIPGRIVRFYAIYGADQFLLNDDGWEQTLIDRFVVGITKDNLQLRHAIEIGKAHEFSGDK